MNYEIEDNGVGRKKAAELKSLFRQKHKSKGMELLSKWFKLLNEEYGSDIKTIITDVVKNDEVDGTLVRIKVPVKLIEQLIRMSSPEPQQMEKLLMKITARAHLYSSARTKADSEHNDKNIFAC